MRINSKTVRFKTTLRHISDFYGFPVAPTSTSAPRVGPAVVTGTSWSISTPRGPALPRLISKVGSHCGGQNGQNMSKSRRYGSLNQHEITFDICDICDISYEWRMNMHNYNLLLFTKSDRVSTKTTTGGEVKHDGVRTRLWEIYFPMFIPAMIIRMTRRAWFQVKPGQPWWITDVHRLHQSFHLSTNDNQGHNQPQFSIISEYQMTGETEIWCFWNLSAGATDINTKLTPEVSTLNKGAAMPWPYDGQKMCQKNTLES